MALTDLLLWALAIVMVAGGLIGLVYPLLPGLPLMFGGFWIAGWINHFERVGAFTLSLLGILVALGIACDFVASALGAKRVGASPRAITGALLGSIVGMFFGFIGLVVGPFVGAALGELSTQRHLGRATQVGVATLIGLLLGTAAKIGIGLAMIGVFALAWFV